MFMPIIRYEKTLAASGAATEEGRRPTTVAALEAASPELSPRARRRSFKAAVGRHLEVRNPLLVSEKAA